MPSKRKKSDSAEQRREMPVALPSPAAALSFLKETRGMPAWNAQDLAKSLNVSAAAAKQVIPFLRAQGYVEASDGGGWLTTASGDAVSGSRQLRCTPEAVEAALSALAERINAANQGTSARFRTTKAVAFGDFLSGRVRVQAADVGVLISSREPASLDTSSAVEMAAEREFIRRLKAKSPLLDIRPYEDWMGSRSHRKLL